MLSRDASDVCWQWPTSVPPNSVCPAPRRTCPQTLMKCDNPHRALPCNPNTLHTPTTNLKIPNSVPKPHRPEYQPGTPKTHHYYPGDNMADYTLPELPYDYAALEPFISGVIMELHHSKHHQAYVTGANAALAALAEARESDNLASVNKFEKDLSFNLGGHINHSIFWTNLAPATGARPEGE